MANLTDSLVYETGIFQLETTTPATGGPGGIANLQAQQLANRTHYLKDALQSAGLLQHAVEIGSGDLNAYEFPGFYTVAASGVSNKPEAGTTGMLIVNGRSSSGYTPTVAQIYTSMSTGRTWVRVILNDVPGSWQLLLGASDAVAPGTVAAYCATTAPTGWLKANGAAVSRTTYPALFAVCGTTFGPGDGSTTFNLPELRGNFVRGWDDGRGADSGRVFGSEQAQAVDLGSGPAIARNLALLWCIKF